MFLVFRKPKLHPRTLALVEALFGSSWFTRLGTEASSDVYVVRDWQEAIVYCEDHDQLLLQTRGDYTAALQRKAPRRDREWNDLVTQLKIVLEPEIDERVKQAPGIPLKGLAEVTGTTRWILLHACMEEELSDVISPGFFRDLVHWYLDGRLPCGWRGSYPGGQLVIY